VIEPELWPCPEKSKLKVDNPADARPRQNGSMRSFDEFPAP
jgi:hypothetical protein